MVWSANVVSVIITLAFAENLQIFTILVQCRYKTFVIFKSVTFEIFRKCSESVNFDANIDLQEDLKIFKSDTFENYKSSVPVEVQSHTSNLHCTYQPHPQSSSDLSI